MTTPSRRQWTDDTIREELLLIVDELGRFPRRNELTERGIGALWSAMGRRGGVDAWREVAVAHLATPTAAPVAVAEVETAVVEVEVETTVVEVTDELADDELSEEHVRIAAYFKFRNGHPGGPESHWHAAERELTTA